LSNGKLVDGDMRSKAARRLRDLSERFKAEIGGGELTATEEMIVANCALAKMKSEEQAAKLAAGEDVSDEDAVRVGNMCSRATRDLYAAKAKRAVVATAGMSPIDRILADLDVRAAEPAEDDDDQDEIEPVEPIERPAPEPSAPVPVEVEAIEPELVVEAVAAAPSPKPAPVIYFNSKSGDQVGRLLHQVVSALIAEGYSPTEIVDIVTPAEGLKSPLGEALNARHVGFMRERPSWFIREVRGIE
jgi:hypothetical protein